MPRDICGAVEARIFRLEGTQMAPEHTVARVWRILVMYLSGVVLLPAMSLAGLSTANAAPGDPVVFANQALEDAVNAALG